MENFTSMPFIHLLAIIESSPQTIIWNSREKNALLKIYTNADFLRQAKYSVHTRDSDSLASPRLPVSQIYLNFAYMLLLIPVYCGRLKLLASKLPGKAINSNICKGPLKHQWVFVRQTNSTYVDRSFHPCLGSF